MEAAARQAALDNISDSDLKKIEDRSRELESNKVSDDAMYLAMLGKHFGWPAIADAMEEKYEWYSWQFANKLLNAANKIEAGKTAAESYTSFVGSVSAQSKKPGTTYKMLTKGIYKAAK